MRRARQRIAAVVLVSGSLHACTTDFDRFRTDAGTGELTAPTTPSETTSAENGELPTSTTAADSAMGSEPGSDCQAMPFYRDQDGDGVGWAGDLQEACTAPEGYVAVAGDCDDDCADCSLGGSERCDGRDNDCDGSTDEATDQTCGTAEGACEPGMQRCEGGQLSACDGAVEAGTEACDGTVDEDCDGTVDEGCACEEGSRPCGSGIGSCVEGEQSCADGVWQTCTGATGPTAEVCDGQDNDCDQSTDEGLTQRSCGSERGECTVGMESCVDGAWLCQGAQASVDETCDGKDNDCDDATDESGGTTWYRDGDGDGHGDPAVTMTACQRPTGYVEAATDCDDGNGAILPSASESCDGVDNNCDARIDEGCTCVDGDSQACDTTRAGTGVCRAGMTTCQNGQWSACMGSVTASTEVCDGMDNNCDGSVDEGLNQTWYADMDGDGYGNPAVPRLACSRPSGYVADSRDCNDGDDGAHPGAAEICDGRNTNCSITSDILDPSVRCDDGMECNGTSCVSRCGNGTINTGEECDPGVSGWSDMTCDPVSCQRTVYIGCEYDRDCPYPGSYCPVQSHPDAGWVSACAPACPGQNPGACPTIPGVDGWQYFCFGEAAYPLCAIGCDSDADCPSGLTCVAGNPRWVCQFVLPP